VPPMEYARLETAVLAHVDDSYYYGAYCRKCKHSARLSLSKLRAHLGDTCPLGENQSQTTSERCSSRQIVITFLAPDQRTGNLCGIVRPQGRRVAGAGMSALQVLWRLTCRRKLGLSFLPTSQIWRSEPWQ